MINNQLSRELLIREGENLMSLSHPNLVRVYEVHTEPNPLIIEETLTGQTLYHLLKNNTTTPLNNLEMAHLGLQLCSVVQYLHNNNILHLDLNTTNIINQPPFLKVIDLSIARQEGICEKGLGSEQFLSPEQAKGGYVSTSTDVWGIGAVLYNVISGKIPFRKFDGSYDQLKRSLPSVRTYKKIPENIVVLLDSCLEVDYKNRPTIGELIDGFNTLTQN